MPHDLSSRRVCFCPTRDSDNPTHVLQWWIMDTAASFLPESSISQLHPYHPSTKSADYNTACPDRISLHHRNNSLRADEEIPQAVSPAVRIPPTHICGTTLPDDPQAVPRCPDPTADGSCPISHIRYWRCAALPPRFQRHDL